MGKYQDSVQGTHGMTLIAGRSKFCNFFFFSEMVSKRKQLVVEYVD